MSVHKRTPIGKRLRFSIFARDQFTCRYCGAQSDKVKLEVDHVVPVCQGGTNDESNLITACQPCNAGKSGKTITQSAPTEADRLRLAQEAKEQEETYLLMKASVDLREKQRQLVVSQFCNARGRSEMSRNVCTRLVGLTEEYGIELVSEWIDIAVSQMKPHSTDVAILQYIYGIRRNWDFEKEVE